jgi:acyl-ACP thioesterase
MKVAIDRELRSTQVDPELRIKPVSLLELFQEAAENHTTQVGLKTQDLLERGFGWMMYKMAVRVEAWPRLGDPIRLRTWSTGIKGYRALREFDIHLGDRPAVVASSLWFAVDLQAGRIQRIPEDMGSVYAVEPPSTAYFDLKAWKPEPFPGGGRKADIGVRPSDFDPYGHVNNAVYLDYLDAALNRQGRSLNRAAEIRILFRQGISPGTERVDVETADSTEAALFRIGSDDTVFAEGRLVWPSP